MLIKIISHIPTQHTSRSKSIVSTSGLSALSLVPTLSMLGVRTPLLLGLICLLPQLLCCSTKTVKNMFSPRSLFSSPADTKVDVVVVGGGIAGSQTSPLSIWSGSA